MILLIDNYDSFVHNLARYFRRLGRETLVVRNDATDVTAIRAMRPRAVVISPGPCTPAEAGCSIQVIRELHRELPILGVCLGHQAIASAFDVRLARAARPVHGRTSTITHGGVGLFADIPSPIAVCRYHSLLIEETALPHDLVVTARTSDGVVMAVAHQRYPLVGVQFHPEAILTEFGYDMLANFLRIAGLEPAADSATLRSAENRTPPAPTPRSFDAPVTF